MSAKMEILDILSTLISRYGSSLDKHFSAVIFVAGIILQIYNFVFQTD